VNIIVRRSQTFKEYSHVGPSNPLSQMEWEKLQASLHRGSEVKGNVVSVYPFGVFVEIGLDPGIPVLLEIIHFKIRQDEPDHRVEFPQDYPKIGDEIEARILAYSMKPHDIRLTQLGHLEWLHSRWLKEHHPEDSLGTGTQGMP
jgi:DNA-directed RNA polymerase subunit E'/Rpb7